MSERLLATERAGAGLRRIFLAQLRDASACLADDGRLSDKRIHKARKSIKRARATLRLLRPAIDRTRFKATNLALRDVARPLSQARDLKVLLDSLEALRRHFGERLDCLSPETLERTLRTERARARKNLSADAQKVAALRRALHEIEREAAQWRIDMDDWELLSPALERIYRQARRAFERASECGTDESLHEWRKKVKHHGYALEILSPLRPKRLGRIADRTHKLCDCLGDDHDLGILNSYIHTVEQDEQMLETFTALIDRRRSSLQDRAFALGERLFRRKPKKWLRIVAASWRRWRASTSPAPA